MKHLFKQLLADINNINTRLNEIADKITEIDSRPPNVGGPIYEFAAEEFAQIKNKISNLSKNIL